MEPSTPPSRVNVLQVRNKNNMEDNRLRQCLDEYRKEHTERVRRMERERLDVIMFLKQLQFCESDTLSEFAGLVSQEEGLKCICGPLDLRPSLPQMTSDPEGWVERSKLAGESSGELEPKTGTQLPAISEQKSSSSARQKSAIITNLKTVSEIDLVAAVNVAQEALLKERPRSAEPACLPSISPEMPSNNNPPMGGLQERSVTLPDLLQGQGESTTRHHSNKYNTRKKVQQKMKKRSAFKAKILEDKLQDFYQKVALLTPREYKDSTVILPSIVEAV